MGHHSRRILMLVFACGAALEAGQRPVTFNRDVAPILQKHCQSCHRPGQAAPMSLLTWDAARPWAKAIRNAVASRRMPPWFADARYGHFSNDPSLLPQDIDTIVEWANGWCSRRGPTGSSATCPVARRRMADPARPGRFACTVSRTRKRGCRVDLCDGPQRLCERYLGDLD